MKESMSSSYDQTTKSAALSLVGKEVIVTDKDSASGYYSGKVDYVTYKDGKIQLSINEKMYATLVSILYQRMSTTMQL